MKKNINIYIKIIYILKIRIIEEKIIEIIKQYYNFPIDDVEDILYEDIYEWNIENWGDLKLETTSEIFKLCDLSW